MPTLVNAEDEWPASLLKQGFDDKEQQCQLKWLAQSCGVKCFTQQMGNLDGCKRLGSNFGKIEVSSLVNAISTANSSGFFAGAEVRRRTKKTFFF